MQVNSGYRGCDNDRGSLLDLLDWLGRDNNAVYRDHANDSTATETNRSGGAANGVFDTEYVPTTEPE